MRLIGLLLVVALAGLACEKSQTPSNGGRPSVSNVEGRRAIDGNDTKTRANGAVAVAARAADGIDAPASSRASGAASAVREHAGSEAIEVELEE